MIRVLYAGHSDRWEEYKRHLLEAFENASMSYRHGVDVCLLNVNDYDISNKQDNIQLSMSTIDYIIYAPSGPITDFSPFINVKAILSLWAGVEKVLTNETISHDIPICRMVDQGKFLFSYFIFWRCSYSQIYKQRNRKFNKHSTLVTLISIKSFFYAVIHCCF